MNNLAEIQDSCSILEPYFSQIRKTVRLSFDTYLQIPPHVRIDHDMRAVGSCLHSHIKHEAIRVFADVHGAQIVETQGLHLVLIERKIACHFKLVDRYGNASSARTKQQDAFSAHSLSLPGMEDAPVSLRVGIVLDESVSRIDHLLLIMPNCNRIAWKAMLSMDDSVTDWVDVTEQKDLRFEVVATGNSLIRGAVNKTAA